MRLTIAGLSASLVLLLGLPDMGEAEGLRLSGSSSNRNALFRSQTALLDGRLSTQYDYSSRLTPGAKEAKAAKSGKSGANVVYKGKYKGEYLEVAKKVARKHGVPEDLFLRLVQQESGWNAGAVSAKGATGLAQLMPGTADHLGVDINDPHENLEGGARYLKMMFVRFGTWELALAAYNAGPLAVEKNNGIPPYEETKNYVLAIMG